MPVGQIVPTNFSDYEPVVSDHRLAGVVGRLRGVFAELAEDTEFVTFIQPRRQVKNPNTGLYQPIPDMAVFAVVSDSPKHPGIKIMNTGTANLHDYRDADIEYGHYAGAEDPLFNIYKQVVNVHLGQIKSLREMN